MAYLISNQPGSEELGSLLGDDDVLLVVILGGVLFVLVDGGRRSIPEQHRAIESLGSRLDPQVRQAGRGQVGQESRVPAILRPVGPAADQQGLTAAPLDRGALDVRN